jgi:hypothetical protein
LIIPDFRTGQPHVSIWHTPTPAAVVSQKKERLYYDSLSSSDDEDYDDYSYPYGPNNDYKLQQFLDSKPKKYQVMLLKFIIVTFPQVITKACNYVLQPGDSYEGNWHVEGKLVDMI